MSHNPPDAVATGGSLGTRGFWGIFATAWLAYFALFVTAAAGEEGMALPAALGLAFFNTVPPAGLSAIVALRRSDLLRPERTLGRTLLIQVGVGILFAVTTATLVTIASEFAAWSEPPPAGVGKAAVFAYRMLSAAFLYVILAGFLMWAESVRRVHESQSLVAREGMLRAQAEAKALRAQFNPHFVFNTLHSLMLLVRADPAAAERAIEDVATLIRYASVLQRQDVDLVPLSKEMEVARRYVALEKLRLEDRLKVVWEVEVETASVAVPPFAVQTLLENAIKHGLEPKSEGGTVVIGASVADGALTLTVSDDGEGADPEVVAGAVGRGLDLLGRRLASLYGEEGAVSWRTRRGGGFVATLRIPVQAPLPVPDRGQGAAALEAYP
jgi:signal transduction histidine kinase